MPDKRFRVGIIGRTGKGNYGHGLDTVWKEMDRIDVVAVADDDAGGRATARQRTGAATAYADYRDMLEREQLDLVAVCPRWIDQHHAMAMACAEHGCHMYLEKPFCPTLAECDDVVTACDMRHLKLSIAHIARHSPVLTVVRQLIADGAIGDLLEIRGRGKEDSRGGGEDLWVLGSHVFDLMRAIAGDVDSCYATVTTDGHPIAKSDVREGNEGLGPLAGDTIDAVYHFRSGVTGFFGSHRGKGSRFGITLYGSGGIIELPAGYLEPAWILQDRTWSPGRSRAEWKPVTSAGIGQPEPLGLKGYAGANPAAVTDLLAAIETDRQPKCSVFDARSATEMIVAVFESQRTGGPVSFPLNNRRNPLTMLRE